MTGLITRFHRCLSPRPSMSSFMVFIDLFVCLFVSDMCNMRLFSNREHHNFLKLCLRLLSNHLALALAGGVATSILGRQARPLRNLLFRLMDASVPDEIQEVSVYMIIGLCLMVFMYFAMLLCML